MDSYNKGIQHLSLLTGIYKPTGNTALVLYDGTGNVYMQVFGPPEKISMMRQIIWEGPVGTVSLPTNTNGPGTSSFGNSIEDSVRILIQQVTGQQFGNKLPNAHGPDLLPE